MFPYIQCYSCGRNLGDLYSAFKILRAERMRGNPSDNTVPLGDILTSLGIIKDCCRVRMLTQVEFKEYYLDAPPK